MSELSNQGGLEGIDEEEIDEEFNDVDEHINQTPKLKNGTSSTTSNNTTKKQQHQSNESKATSSQPLIPELPELSRKDMTLKKVLDLMDDEFQPIIPDVITDYYLSKNGFETSNIKIKRLLALATQKFISDVTQDAYEYSRIRNSSAVYNSSNPQVRAKQLLQGQQYANQQSMTGASNLGGGDAAAAGGDGAAGGVDGNATGNEQQQPTHSNAGNQQGKIVLTMEDLSSALSEYGMNTSRPDFYR
ncbi:transcription initiation factor TFIID 23-30kDa subunit-domain-containing protein [Scheffersomyces coipomensis]|uniref:transcription initiation factor TFIID 23-30kDa subunit-domain-containing protein n=1 Tax=Scheffersomyces coipomensis TaxID=1788519 RepID=UPI00315C5484